MEVVFFHSFYLWISIRIFSFTTLEQVMGPQNKKFNEIKLFYIFFERNNYRKIHGLQVCLVLWSCVCFWELPRLKFERVESKGDFISLSWLRFAQCQFCFASLLTGSTWVLLTLKLQTGENIYNFTGCLCRHHFYTMDFFFHSLFLRNTFTANHLFLASSKLSRFRR